MESEKWYPNDGEVFYAVIGPDHIKMYRKHETSRIVKKHLDIGNCFKTYEEAEQLSNAFLDMLKSESNPKIENIDWEQRRYEIAKEALSGMISVPKTTPWSYQEYALRATNLADALIEELKK